MISFEQFKRDEKEKLAERADYTCEICNQPAQTGERGHIIAQTKSNYKIFGKWFIDCAANCRWVHQKCNKQADIGDFLEGREEHIRKVVQYLNMLNICSYVIYDPVTKREYKV